jgi:uncharacterized protein with PIN domain
MSEQKEIRVGNGLFCCPKCGFTGRDSEFDAAIKQTKGKYGQEVNVGFQCRKCKKKFW